MRVVFFGTPAFAVPSLRALLDENLTVEAVVTQPDRAQGRSRSELIASPVKEEALTLGLPVLQPERPAGDLFVAGLKRFAPELGIVVAYGHILRPEILGIPTHGMINVHASLLPRHRGAGPIQGAILAGDSRTGVTIMQMDEGMDTGAMLHAANTPILPGETAGSLAERLADLGARALVETIGLMRDGALRPVAQEEAAATLAPKLSRDAARIDWTQGADVVARGIRAYDPSPGAWSLLNGAAMKLFGPMPLPEEGRPGEVLRTVPELVIGTGNGVVSIAEVQPAGRRRMTARDWVRGRHPGDEGQFR